MTHDEMIKVIQAHKDGGWVQYKPFQHDEWRDCTIDTGWNFVNFEYRVKPLVVWVNEDEDGAIYAYRSKPNAEAMANQIQYKRSVVKMVEAED